MPETTPLIKAALNLRGGAGFDVYILCFTSDNKKSPWLLYEAGYASGLHKRVIPILFDKDSLWHSWIDNPMNVYCSFVALFLSLLS